MPQQNDCQTNCNQFEDFPMKTIKARVTGLLNKSIFNASYLYSLRQLSLLSMCHQLLLQFQAIIQLTGFLVIVYSK